MEFETWQVMANTSKVRCRPFPSAAPEIGRHAVAWCTSNQPGLHPTTFR